MTCTDGWQLVFQVLVVVLGVGAGATGLGMLLIWWICRRL